MKKLRIDESKLGRWVQDNGGAEDSAVKIYEALRCSLSKALQMAKGRYPHGLSESEQRELVRLTKMPKDELFAQPGKAGARAS